MADVATMTKKRKPRWLDKRDELIAMRSTPEFKQWLESAAEKTHHTPTQLLEMGLIGLADKLGLEPPPKR